MALLHSLEICGVRNFSPDDKQTIDFDIPVTLFVGQNGCGKTTIIECIKFALTSQPPSGSNKVQFLNVPQMSNKTSTKGSIVIKFSDADGKMITVSRSMSVTSKVGGELTFKKLDSSVRRGDKDDLINTKDFDNYCSKSLNVSKSVLNNVLFCHQENSAWPLDEPQKLKEKFDEIFDYTKYNKLIDNMQMVIKDKRRNFNNTENKLTNMQRLKDAVAAKLSKFNKKMDELNGIKETIALEENELKLLEKRLQEILDRTEHSRKLQADLEKEEARREVLIEHLQRIKNDITHIFEGSDDELQNKISSFESEKATEENALKELEKENTEITRQLTELASNVLNKQNHFALLEEEQMKYRKKLEKFEECSERMRLSMELKEFSDVNDRPSVLRELQDALKILEKNYNTLANDNETEELKLQQQIDEIREKNAGTKQMILFKNISIEECLNKLKPIRDKLDKLATSDSQLRIVEEEIKKLQATLTELKSSFNETEKLQEIEKFKKEVERNDQLLKNLDSEYRILQQNYVTEQKLEGEKSLIIEKQSEVAKIKNKHSHNLQKLFGEDVPERNFKKLVQQIQYREENKFKALTLKINKLEKELTRVETTMDHQKKNLVNDQNNLAFNKEKVSQLCSGKPFIEVLNETHKKKEKLQKEKGKLSSGKIMYEEFISKFERESPCCPICQTDFASKHSTVSDIITNLRSEIERIPTQLSQKESDLKEAEDLYNKLQQLKPITEEIELLTAVKIPKIEDEINYLNVQFKEKSTELQEEKDNRYAPQELIDTSKRIITDATLLDQYLSDIDRANAVIAELEKKIIKVPSNRSRQETESEIDIVKAELSNAKNRYDSSKKMLDQHRDSCQNLVKNVQAETQKQIDIQRMVQEKLLKRQDTEYSKKLDVLKTEVDELEDSNVVQQRLLDNKIENRQSVVRTNKEIKADKCSKIDENKNTLQYIQMLMVSIDETNEIDSKLDKNEEELAEVKNNEKKLEETKNKVVEAISSKKEALAKKESQFRALKDNVMIRETQKSQAKMDFLIEVLKKKIGDNSLQVFDENEKKEKEVFDKKMQISVMIGQCQEIEKQVSELEKELAKPENKNANNNYKKLFYEQAVIKLTINDLNNFVVVLEKSVLKFHEERMVHINRIIRELWRSIYRGNDIDYIEIKTDENMTGGEGKRRTYNYKVVQVKNNVELEMRGRCSAGQKVLACLVIRMALAEAFSAHCGILALDEPTTNLDRENILSLSDALSRIVADRERESNFQLLIITHDEDFLRSLTQVQSLDSYWRVKRNQDGFSYVEKHFL